MFLVKYPHKVKIDDTYYQPNTPIEVFDADEHVKRGAVVVEEVAAAPKKTAAKRQRKVVAE